ncbi:MAG: outer membrane protein assembly factor BamA [Myxococcales bacterium]|nr:outer membrane protein assembly factor BamA [Myxococcota bacterium]MDW8280486.1 outer membrane protein assembly factor BamA [Myxococcales bacterium]
MNAERLLGLVLVTLALLLSRPLHAEEEPTVEAIRIRGNRKVETEAIQLNLSTEVGQPLNRGRLQEDLRAIWKMGYFNDVKVEAEEGDSGGVVLTFVVREKPSIRKIYVSGNNEVSLDKINEVLDLKKDTIYDPAKVKRNAEKIRDLYVEKGYYLADVRFETRPFSPTQIDVYFIIDERAKVEVRQVRFIGNRHATDAEIRAVMSTREGGWLSFLTSSGTYKEEAFERDILLITALYYDKGFVNVKIGKPQIELSADKRYLYITIPIEEGDVYRIGKLDFKGELLWPRDQMLRRLSVKSGDRFNRSKLGNDIIRLNDLYKDRGYAYVNVTPLTAVDVEKRTVDITFDMQTGPKVYFERINIRGNSKTRDKVIRRELKISEGDLYSQTLLDLSKRRVQALGFFEKVDLSTRRGSREDRIEVNIEVSERPTGTFQIGAGFSSIENFIGQAQVAQNNLFGRGTTLQLQAQISSLRQLFSLRYVDPYFLDTNITFAFSGYNQLLFYPSFNRTARGGDLTWGYLLGDYVRVFGTYKLEWVQVGQNQAGLNIAGFGNFFTIAGGTLSNLYRTGWTSAVRLSMNYDSRNDRLFPTKGMFHSLSVELADQYIASEIDYVRVSGFARFYQPIWGPFIFRLNFESGVIVSRRAEGVPIYERYFLGGIQTIRGYRLFSLGPRIQVQQDLDPASFLQQFTVGANWQIILNSEVEFLILPAVQIKGVLFFDAGNGYNLEPKYCTSATANANIPVVFNPCQFYPTFQNLRYSVGFGFRWFSPIGPLRFEWGIPLNRQQGEDNIVFEFTIGNFF